MSTDYYHRKRGRIKRWDSNNFWGIVYVKDKDGIEREAFFHGSEFKPNIILKPGDMIEFRLVETSPSKSHQYKIKAIDCVLLTFVPPEEQEEIERLIVYLEQKDRRERE